MTELETTSFAFALARALSARGMTASALARKVWGNEAAKSGAKNRQLISQYLLGQVLPRNGTIARLAEALEIPVSELTGSVSAVPAIPSPAPGSSPGVTRGSRPGRNTAGGNLSLIAVAEAGKVRLQVNRVIDQQTALKIFDMLSA
jgi:transcriptional regulator with XRE-family HTH domain